jgi:ParB family transcriptional regulator, chromosome partitioning protein
MTDELMAEAEQLELRHDELAGTVEALAVYADKDRAIAGCIVTIGDDGEFRLHEGLVERSAIRGGNGAAASDTGDDGDEEPVSASSEEDDARGPSPTGEQAVRKECGFSQVLVDDLKAHRLQITRAHLAGDFGVAFDLALYSLAAGLLHQGYRSRPLDLRAIETRPRSSLGDLAGTPADRQLEAHRNALDLDWLSLPPAEGFEALCALPPDAKQRLFAWCVASCLNAQLAVEDRADPVVECAGARLAIPFADYWRPTAANYWGRVKKAHGLAIAKAILGPRWARDHADDKKATLAAALEKAFDPAANAAPIGLDQAARDGAGAWLPPGMAYGDAAVDGTEADPELNGASAIEVDTRDSETGDVDAASSDLPAFLTGDEPAGHAGLNGAASV